MSSLEHTLNVYELILLEDAVGGGCVVLIKISRGMHSYCSSYGISFLCDTSHYLCTALTNIQTHVRTYQNTPIVTNEFRSVGLSPVTY